jgi:sigma-B regulation protein RsbU (phosphoserine phosphatase)
VPTPVPTPGPPPARRADLHTLLAPRLSRLPGIEAAGAVAPADGVLAGDWFDVCRRDDGRWWLVLVDVAGHGAVAGSLALRLKRLLLPSLAGDASPAEALAHAAAAVADWDELFATVLIVTGTPDGPALRYANAGHPAPFILGDGPPRRLPPTGPLLSPLLAGTGWATGAAALHPGDWLVAYTDGLVEARDRAGAEFGEHRLLDLAAAARGRRAGAVTLLSDTLRAVREFQAGARDDCTLAVLARRPPGADPGADPAADPAADAVRDAEPDPRVPDGVGPAAAAAPPT